MGTYLTDQRFPESPDVHVLAPAVDLLPTESTESERENRWRETVVWRQVRRSENGVTGPMNL